MPAWLTSPRSQLVLVMPLALGAIGGAWFSELALGYVPCMLCLWERWPYYLGLSLLISGLVLLRGPRAIHLPRLAMVLGVIFLGSMVLGAYHAGVEWKWFPAPDCGGRIGGAEMSLEAFRKSLNTARVVLCNEAPMRILGLSFAGWNAVVSAVIAGLCWRVAKS